MAGTTACALVDVGQATTDLSRLLARVEAGEAVEIARDGVPVAQARSERLTIVTADRRIAVYDVPVVDAG